MSTTRIRRKRRTDRQVLKHGKAAKRRHARVGGRTGQQMTKWCGRRDRRLQAAADLVAGDHSGDLDQRERPWANRGQINDLVSSTAAMSGRPMTASEDRSGREHAKAIPSAPSID